MVVLPNSGCFAMSILSFDRNSRLKWPFTAILLVVFPLFFVGGPDWTSGPLYRSVWDLGHILFFGLLTLIIRMHFGIKGWRQWLGIIAGVFLASIVIEYLQSYTDRQLDWGDILRNLIGAGLVIAWGSPTDRPGEASPAAFRTTVWAGRVAVTVLLALELFAVADVATQQYQIERGLPLLADLESPRVLEHWSGNLERSREHGRNGDHSLEITLETGRYSGVSLNNMPNDWRDYGHLRLDLFNPGTTPLALTLRINDQQHERGSNAYGDRFNTRLVATPGWNHYQIDLSEVQAAPASRSMDMARIRRLGLFTSGLQAPRKLFLAGLRLE